MSEDAIVERRAGYVEVKKDFLEKVSKHMDKEDGWEKQLEQGAARMTVIETSLTGLVGLAQTAEGFIKAMRIVALVFGLTLTIFGVLVGVITWVVLEKNEDMKTIQKTVQAQVVQNAEQIAIVKILAMSQEKDSARLERHLDAVGSVGSGERQR